jgi:hypothetical protein
MKILQLNYQMFLSAWLLLCRVTQNHFDKVCKSLERMLILALVAAVLHILENQDVIIPFHTFDLAKQHASFASASSSVDDDE